MAKKTERKKATKRRFGAGGATSEDLLSRVLRSDESSAGDIVRRRSPSDIDAPRRRDLVKKGPRNVTRPGRPTIDIDAPRQLRGMKDVPNGNAQRVQRPALTGPSTDRPNKTPQRPKLGVGAKALTGLGLMAYSPAVGEGSDKPQHYPGEGMKPRAAFPQGRAESSIPAPKAQPASKPKPTSTVGKPKSQTKTANRASEEDAFLNDLRASAARMKNATSDMASKTGRMKGAMEEFQSAADDADNGYKRGGRVGGRGDGKAIRGKTKGRFI